MLARALKRPRLVWTPKLHQRFVEAVEQLGLKIAVPKTIMQVVSHPLLVMRFLMGLCAAAQKKSLCQHRAHDMILSLDSMDRLCSTSLVQCDDCQPGMQMMNVEGLTRENVASHLQKFRLQLKRENRLDDEGNLISPLKVKIVDAISVHGLFLLHVLCVDSVQACPA